MGISNLNFTELFRRIGSAIGGDTEVDLSRTARLTIGAGDFSHLTPPVPVPVGGQSHLIPAGGVNDVAQFTLQCLAPGGLYPVTAVTDQNDRWFMWITDTNPFGALDPPGLPNEYAFGQVSGSRFHRVTAPALPIVPGFTPFVRGFAFSQLSSVPIFVGPGQFLNFESDEAQTAKELSIYWQEIPAPQISIAPPA